MAALDYVTLSYSIPQLFDPQVFKSRGSIDPNSRRFYSAVILIPRFDADLSWSEFYSSNPDAVKKLAEQTETLQRECFQMITENRKESPEQIWKAVENGLIMWPFHSTDDPRLNTRGDGTQKVDSTRFAYSLNARRYEEQGRPQLLDRYPDVPPKLSATGKVKPREIVAPETNRLYAGSIAKVDVSFYWTTKGAKPGIAVGLNAVQHWADGPRLDGRAPREFDADENIPHEMATDPAAAPQRDIGVEPAAGPRADEVRRAFFPNFGGNRAA